MSCPTRRRLVIHLWAVTLAAVAAAQTVKTNHVVGWVPGGATGIGTVQIQDIDNSCQPAKILHSALFSSANPWAGGTAYDPRHQSVWVSDGKTLAELRLSDGKTLCRVAAQLMDAKALVSGLAIADHGRRLIQLETRLGYGAIRSYDLRTCPPTPLRDGCAVQVSTGYFTAGLAYDELESLVYYTVTKPGFQVPQNWLHVADDRDRCRSICSLRVGGCPHLLGTDVTGLAYESCSKTLYATVGAATAVIRVGDPRKCEFKVSSCCAKGQFGPYRGLAVVPGWTQFKKGRSCITKGCPFCSKLDLSLDGGAPSLGNQEFGIRVVNGPTNGLGILGLGVSSCGKGVPFSCGALWLPGNPLIVVAGRLSGPQCGAALRVPLPVPVDGMLCGQSVCLQWVVDCGGGEGVTSALQFTIAGT